MCAHTLCCKSFILLFSELYDNLGKMSATLKENIVSGMKNMWESLSEFARSHTTGATGLPQEQPDTPTEPSPSREDTPEGMVYWTMCVQHVHKWCIEPTQ